MTARAELPAMVPSASERARIVLAELIRGVHANQAIGGALTAAHRDGAAAGAEAERERIRKMLADDAVVEAATVAAFEEEENARRALGIQRTEWAALGSSFQDNWRSKTRASFRDLAALLDAEAGDA